MNIYTDGACKENLRDNGVGCGTGGWAFVILDQEDGKDMEIVISDSGFKSGTTNQEMEIVAVAKAFEALRNSNYVVSSEIILYSDSAYVINCFKDRWYEKWQSNGWLNNKKKPVENRESWERAIESIEGFSVVFHHVNRNTAKYITMVDGMAKRASKKETNQAQL